ncbi:MAG: DUF5615 family PIN-like protein [Candidatus Schekmanbacteria bacterium]|nr:DUF5615 family PIN-like protein [Candidatus Schekmanbacteria bacterium]
MADENIHVDIIKALKKSGYDVATVKEIKLDGKPDEVILAKANSEKRILITADKDFGGIIEHGRLAGKGRIVLLRYKLLNIPLIAKDVQSVLKEVEKDFIDDPGLIVVLSEGRYRLHHHKVKRS